MSAFSTSFSAGFHGFFDDFENSEDERDEEDLNGEWNGGGNGRRGRDQNKSKTLQRDLVESDEEEEDDDVEDEDDDDDDDDDDLLEEEDVDDDDFKHSARRSNLLDTADMEDDSDDDDDDKQQKAAQPSSSKKAKQKKATKKSAADATNGNTTTTTSLRKASAPSAVNNHNADSFAALQLSRPLLRACTSLGFVAPTPIQAAVIPAALMGRDVCGRAVTGSGKTAAFVLPTLERLLHRDRRVALTRALFLLPTRELAVQVHDVTNSLAQFTDARAALVVGGLSISAQASALRTRPDIVVGTPGRLIDHVRNSASVALDGVQILVLDEADRLLALGFQDELQELLRLCPASAAGRQTMLFSATLGDNVKGGKVPAVAMQLAKLQSVALRNPVSLSADPMGATPAQLTHELIRVRQGHEKEKEAMLLAVVDRAFFPRSAEESATATSVSPPVARSAIVFVATKALVRRLRILLQLLAFSDAPARVAELHGGRSQQQRLDALEALRAGDVSVLIATDVAARGLDVSHVDLVVSYDAPSTVDAYLHRAGRTARAGRAGACVTLAGERDRGLLRELGKSAKALSLKARSIAPATLARWQHALGDAAVTISRIESDAREDDAMHQADIEAKRALNLVEHASNISARPARTWFASTAEKKRASAAGHEEAAVEVGKKRRRADDVAAAEATKRSSVRAANKQARGSGGGRPTSQRRDDGKDEMDAIRRRLKGLKRKERAVRENGLAGPQFRLAKKDKAKGANGKRRQATQRPTR